MNSIQNMIVTAPVPSVAPYGHDWLRGYDCKDAITFPQPNSYWEAVANPNLLFLHGDSSYSSFLEIIVNLRIVLKQQIGIQIYYVGGLLILKY